MEGMQEWNRNTEHGPGRGLWHTESDRWEILFRGDDTRMVVNTS